MSVVAREHNPVLENSFGSCYVSHISLGLSGAGSDFFICISMCFLESYDGYFIFRVPSASALVFNSPLVLKQCEGLVEVIGKLTCLFLTLAKY